MKTIYKLINVPTTLYSYDEGMGPDLDYSIMWDYLIWFGLVNNEYVFYTHYDFQNEIVEKHLQKNNIKYKKINPNSKINRTRRSDDVENKIKLIKENLSNKDIADWRKFEKVDINESSLIWIVKEKYIVPMGVEFRIFDFFLDNKREWEYLINIDWNLYLVQLSFRDRKILKFRRLPSKEYEEYLWLEKD